MSKSEQALCSELEQFCTNHDLPYVEADELLHHELTPEQRGWVSNFIVRWGDLMAEEA